MENNILTNSEYYFHMEWLRSDMWIRLEEFKVKNPGIDISEQIKKLQIVSDVQTYINKLFRDYEMEQRISYKFQEQNLNLLYENDKLKKELEILKSNINF